MNNKQQWLLLKWHLAMVCLIFLTSCMYTEFATPTTIALYPTVTFFAPTLTPIIFPSPTLTPTAIKIPENIDQLATVVDTVPFATPTPTLPPPTPTWTPLPPNFLTELPPISQDLFVIADGSLKVWQYTTGTVETLLEAEPGETETDQQTQVGNITRFQIATERRLLVAARQTNDHPPTHTLLWLDLESGESGDIVTSAPYLLDFEISPDGQQVAYTLGDPTSLGDIGNRQMMPFKGTIYLQSLTFTQPPQAIGFCSNVNLEGEEKEWSGCRELLWYPDGQQIVWSDASGIWAYQLNLATTVLLQPNLYHIDGGFQLNVFSPMDWSPSGRYLRVDVGHYEGGNESIFDLQNKQLIEIPYTFSYEGPVVTSTAWMKDDRIFMVRTEGPFMDFTNYVEIWRIVPEEGKLVLEQSINIQIGPQAYVSEAAQLADGSLMFAVFSYEEGDNSAGLYRLNPDQEIPQNLHQLPPQIDYHGLVYWVTGGGGALVLWFEDPNYDFVYVEFDNALFYYVRPLLGQTILFSRSRDIQPVWSD